ncbi:MAG: deoxynucleoside kinase, partial [Thermosynechococcaceae cyanobacterium]
NAVFEKFKVNPFWKIFYSNPAHYAFETELTFLLQHYHQIKLSFEYSSSFVCDFSLLLDLAYADVTLQDSKKKAFLSVYDEAVKELPTPALAIYLMCDPEIELKRIRKRGRSVENSITIEFLRSLNLSLEKRVSDFHGNILTIDSEHFNFANDEQAQKKVIELVQNSLPELS